jgi:predicted DNA-binding protein (MmcQ/YjbR family)
MIDIELIREYCLSFPGAFEQLQWESSLLFKVGPKRSGKIFVIYSLFQESVNRISLKCSPEKFDELAEMDNVIPAPYLARNKWITIQDGCRMKTAELKELISGSYELVFSNLPKKIRAGLRRS